MRQTHSPLHLEGFFRGRNTFLQQSLSRIKAAIDRRRLYHTTFEQLSILPDRDLADLKIPRSQIKQFARETAYGR
ncbi:DUF1127 domain-containing protein [Rhodobacteraceae bacterium KMM 6894]|nr:DUF1127 domain-containing protein [Rhodobacteraceae bacterium KMM 6894]